MNIKRITFSSISLFFLLLSTLLLIAPPSAHAAGVVNDCSNSTQFLNALSGGGTVTFTCSGTITIGSTVAINSDTTIDGAGQTVTISGGNSVGVFSIAASRTLTLQNLTIANGSAISGGGAVYVNSGATLNLIDSVVSNNIATVGGAIVNTGGTVFIDGSTLADNDTVSGGTGGAIYSFGGSLTIVDSELTGNTATGNGGALSVNSTANISNSSFSGNTSTATQYAGGAIFNDGTLTVDNVTFSGNRAINNRQSVGGAIANRSALTVRNSTFDNNVADAYGGAIATNANMTVTYSSFSGNGGEIGGGALANFGGTILIADNSFNGNYASGSGVGGAIHNAFGTLNVTRNLFYNNNAGNNISAGGAIRNAGTLHLSNSTFNLNVSYNGGGVNNSGTAYITNNTFSGNTSGGGPGGGVSHIGGATTLTNNILANNSSSNCYGSITDGGGNITWPDTDASCPSDKVDPQLGALQNNGGTTLTMMPASTSPAIDRNPSAACASSPLDGIDQRGRARNADGNGAASANECDSGAVEYHTAVPAQNCTLTENSDIPIGGITFNIATGGMGDLACIKVEDMGPVDHPLATSGGSGQGIATGHWWHIYGEDSAGRRVTNGFNLAVTLPFAGADGSSRVCKHPGNNGGAGWDCGDDADNTEGANVVTRTGITSFSAFAVGDSVTPTAVSLQSIAANPNLTGFGSLAGLLAVLMLGLGTAVAALRRRHTD